MAQLPAGPIWALHSFYVVTSALMLVWHLHYAGTAPRSDAIPATLGAPHEHEEIETVIIGAGQAGLATALPPPATRAGPAWSSTRNQRVGDNWRAQWDTLRLYTPAGVRRPARACRSPGRRWSYPTKDEVADYLDAYADRFDLPVRTGSPGRPAGGRRRWVRRCDR